MNYAKPVQLLLLRHCVHLFADEFQVARWAADGQPAAADRS
jgi:hypothetical protein